MEILDQAYLNDLVIRSGRGDSNAFAELFAAVWEGQYIYLYAMFGEREKAEEALCSVFAQALRRLPSLPKAGLFLSWISRMSYLYCRERQEDIPDAGTAEQSSFSLTQILNLPLTESQILLMTCEQGLTDEETGRILNISGILLRRYRKDGLRHLRSAVQPRHRKAGTRLPEARPDAA